MRVIRGRSFSTAWQRFFTSQAIVPILIGSLALGVAGNAVFGLLSSWLGTTWSAMVGILFISFVCLAGAIVSFMYLASRVRDDTDFKRKKPDARRGLILLVSNEQACRTAIDFHLSTLIYCRLIHSEQSLPIAIALQNEYSAQIADIDLVPIYDVYDPIELKETVEQIYARLPKNLSEQDVILDFTGMTAVASVGAVLACLNKDRPIQYVSAKAGSAGEKKSWPPMEVVLTTKNPTAPGAATELDPGTVPQDPA